MSLGIENIFLIVTYCFTFIKNLVLELGFALPTLDPSMFT